MVRAQSGAVPRVVIPNLGRRFFKDVSCQGHVLAAYQGKATSTEMQPGTKVFAFPKAL